MTGSLVQCLCDLPDVLVDETCMCGHAMDEHDVNGQCQAMEELSGPPLPDPGRTFTCPDCRNVSGHPNDVRNNYCYRCHAFKYEPDMPPRCMEPTCPDFGDHDFGEGTCPAEHAIPPARRSLPEEHK